MRERDAGRCARRFVAECYPAISHWNIDLAVEHDGERSKSWSFGVRPDEEERERERHHGYDVDRGLVGYVHADGRVEGLY